MQFGAVLHEPKSALSYAYDENTLHIRIKTGKGDVSKVTLQAVDPFNWSPDLDNLPAYRFETETIKKIPMKKECSTEFHDVWFCEVKGFETKRIRYAFILENKNECIFAGCHGFVNLQEREEERNNIFNYYNFPYVNEEDVYQAPGWVKDTVWYQIFPDSFYNGDNSTWGTCIQTGENGKYGGNLQGVIEKLDYLKDLGINGIYFTPIFTSVSSHKYDTTDYMNIDPMLGDNEVFRTLVNEAHNRGIRIMLDAVFNHCGEKHPFWQDVLKNGKNSKYYDCFYILDESKPIAYETKAGEMNGNVDRERLNYRTFGFVPGMPKWRTGNPVVREYLLNVAEYWVKEYHIDGWRLDVSNEVSHDFWREFRKRIQKINSEVYILGENWDNSYSWLRGDQFHAVMNYEFMNILWNFLGVSGECKDNYNATQFKWKLSQLQIDYPQNVTQNMFNHVDSHDTARIHTVCGENLNRTMLAYVIQMTYAGAPSIYYGSEKGAVGSENSNRICMSWEKTAIGDELTEHLKTLIRIRKNEEACRTIETNWLLTDNSTGTVLYKKTAKNKTLYILIHNSESEDIVELPDELKNQEVIDLYHRKNVRFEKSLKVKPYEFAIWKGTVKE